MEENFAIVTPEKVSFSIELAGLGSRFAALFIDTMLLSVLTIAIAMGGAFTAAVVDEFSSTGASIVGGVTAVLGLIFFWGYFVFFEYLMRGQTLGKKMVGIRVMTSAGRPPGLAAVTIRNLLRIADWLPFFFTVGVICITARKDNRRLGDLAAGTLVARDRARQLGIALPDNRSLDVPAGVRLAARRLTSKEYEILEQFVSRRREFDEEHRAKLAEKLAGGFSFNKRIAISDDDDELFLEQLLSAYREGTSASKADN